MIFADVQNSENCADYRIKHHAQNPQPLRVRRKYFYTSTCHIHHSWLCENNFFTWRVTFLLCRYWYCFSHPPRFLHFHNWPRGGSKTCFRVWKVETIDVLRAYLQNCKSINFFMMTLLFYKYFSMLWSRMVPSFLINLHSMVGNSYLHSISHGLCCLELYLHSEFYRNHPIFDLIKGA